MIDDDDFAETFQFIGVGNRTAGDAADDCRSRLVEHAFPNFTVAAVLSEESGKRAADRFFQTTLHTAEAVGIADSDVGRRADVHVFCGQVGHGGAFVSGFLRGGDAVFACFFSGGKTGFGGFFTRFGFLAALLGFTLFQVFQQIVQALFVFFVVDFFLRLFCHLRVLAAAFSLFGSVGYTLAAQRGLNVDLKFFQVCQLVVDFLLLRCQLFLLLLKVFDDLIVGGVDIAGVTQEAGFLTRLGIFQKQGNGVRLAVFIVA